ncbi:MAG: multiheme c-type cytochrome [Coriobacteriia bacterium]
MKAKLSTAVLLIIVGVALWVSPASALPSLASGAFQPVMGCGCHAALLDQWQASMHSKAVTDPLFRYKMGEADKASNGALGPFCNGCHAPVAVMSGELKGTDQSGVSEVGVQSISCDFCHQVVGTEGTLGNTSVKMQADGTKRAQLKDAVSPAHATAFSAFHQSADFCGNCHNVDHPVNGMHLEMTYSEWKNGPYAKEGIVCQDCHMTPGPGVTKPTPGKAAAMAPEREHIYQMTFVGGNVGLGDAARAEENLKAAATLDVELPDIVEAGSPVAIATTITNVGAGHSIPTGLTEVRQMWLEVKAVDAAGKELLSERRDFGTVLKDKAGKYPVELWEADGIQSDDRIAPRESAVNDYEFAMADGPVTVTATLNYRSASEEFAKAAGVEIPTTVMASVTKTVYNSEAARTEAEAEKYKSGEPAAGGWGTLAMLAAVIVGAIVVVALIYFLGRGKEAN